MHMALLGDIGKEVENEKYESSQLYQLSVKY